MRPRIGISAYWRAASWGPWTDYAATLVPQNYVEAVRDAGGAPLLIPPDPDGCDEALDAIHGLVLVGGEDIGPAHYGAEPHETTDPPNTRRDRAELALLAGALERDMPVLAICRGFQLLNILRGGDLIQHVGDVVDGAVHRPQLGTFGRHRVDVGPSRLRDLVGDHVPLVHSHHHQGIDRLGAGLVVTARDEDGMIEAIEDPDRDFCLGVLWHPEEAGRSGDAGAPLFAGLVEHAATFAARV